LPASPEPESSQINLKEVFFLSDDFSSKSSIETMIGLNNIEDSNAFIIQYIKS
jgi:hypothetical protein